MRRKILFRIQIHRNKSINASFFGSPHGATPTRHHPVCLLPHSRPVTRIAADSAALQCGRRGGRPPLQSSPNGDASFPKGDAKTLVAPAAHFIRPPLPIVSLRGGSLSRTGTCPASRPGTKKERRPAASPFLHFCFLLSCALI